MAVNQYALITFENEADFNNISRIIQCLNEHHFMWYFDNTHMCPKFAADQTTNYLNNPSQILHIVYM